MLKLCITLSIHIPVYGKSLEDHVNSQTTGVLQSILVAMTTGSRDETGNEDDVDEEQAKQDAVDMRDVRIKIFF